MVAFRLTTVLTLVLVFACAGKKSDPKDNTYPMTATIVSRDPAKNTVNLDNKEVPGQMMAMKMDYELRGAKVSSLPPNGTAVVVTMHDVNGVYYVTDVRPKK